MKSLDEIPALELFDTATNITACIAAIERFDSDALEIFITKIILKSKLEDRESYFNTLWQTLNNTESQVKEDQVKKEQIISQLLKLQDEEYKYLTREHDHARK